jgi:hypothetical protein
MCDVLTGDVLTCDVLVRTCDVLVRTCDVLMCSWDVRRAGRPEGLRYGRMQQGSTGVRPVFQ